MLTAPASQLLRRHARIRQDSERTFVRRLRAVVGTDTLLIHLARPPDTTTSKDLSRYGRTVTHSASIAARMSKLGKGYTVTYDGASQFSSALDAAELSPGLGTSDQAFSCVILASIGAAGSGMIGKASEFRFLINGGGVPAVLLFDASSGGNPFSSADLAPANIGSQRLYGFSYNGAGAGAAAAGISFYKDGVAQTGFPTESGTYTAMENTANNLIFGSDSSSLLTGSQTLTLYCMGALSAAQHLAIKQLVNRYFGLAL